MLLGLSYPQRSFALSNECNNFIKNPTKKILLVLRSAKEKNCWAAAKNNPTNSEIRNGNGTEEQLYHLFKKIEKGNQWAAEYLLEIYEKDIKSYYGVADGAGIAMGLFAEKNPEAFLTLAKIGKLSDVNIIASFGMLPESLVDHFQAQKRRRQLRYNLIDSIKRKDLQETKKRVLRLFGN